jgi:transposase-like protein
MKTKEKQKALEMRKNGMAMGEIARKLGVAKSSVSYWVRDVSLTNKQRERLNKNGHSVNAIEKRRVARLANTSKRRAIIIEAAGDEVSCLLQEPLWCIGVALYWGEGGKTQQTARLANSDPAVIAIMMRFFKKYSNVPETKFRGHVHTFSHKNAKKAVKYWSTISGIPENKFYKTYIKQSSASKNKRDTVPYGTLQVYVHDTEFFFRLMGWINKLKNFDL